jgi:hypothetical protein
MLGCDIHTKPNNGLFHGDLKTPLKELVKFNKNVSKINQTYTGNKFSRKKMQFLHRKIAKFLQNLFYWCQQQTEMWKSAHNVLMDEAICNEEE